MSQQLSRRCVLGLLSAAALPVKAIAATSVDLALVLAVDCSYSVDTFEYQLQMRGTGQAFLDPDILEAVLRGPLQKIAITVFLWSDEDAQFVIIPWRLFASEADGMEIAQILLRSPRNLYRGSTATGSALKFAQSLLAIAPFSIRQSIDISTDGYSNIGLKVPTIRKQIIDDGITINGLAIENEVKHLSQYLAEEIIGGDGSFVTKANGYEDYAEAIKIKLLKEITNASLI